MEIYNCKDKSKVPCLCHCNNVVLEKMIESGMNRAYKKALEENVTKIADERRAGALVPLVACKYCAP